MVWPDGSVHWIHGAGQVTLGPDGEVTGAIGFSADVTEQVLGRQELHRLTGEALEAAEHERRSRERLEALGRINDALAESRERDDLLRNVTAAAVPALGDSCAIYVLTPSRARSRSRSPIATRPSPRSCGRRCWRARPTTARRRAACPG